MPCTSWLLHWPAGHVALGNLVGRIVSGPAPG